MKRTARFIGKDGSAGLHKDEVYQIEIVYNRGKRDWADWRVFVNDIGIPYDTMNAIKKNWELL